MAASAAICALCIRAFSGSLSSSGAALVRAGGPAGGSAGSGCRASSSWRARCCRCRSVSITACSFMALRAGPPRAPGVGGGGGPFGEGARPHCSVGAAGELGQCRVAGGGGRWAQAEGWRGMPTEGRQCLLLTLGTRGQRLASSSFTCLQKPGGRKRDSQTTLGSSAPFSPLRLDHKGLWENPSHSHQGANLEASLEAEDHALPIYPHSVRSPVGWEVGSPCTEFPQEL